MKRIAAIAASVLTTMMATGSMASAASIAPSSKDYGGQTVGTSSPFADFHLSTSSTHCTDPPMCFVIQTYTVDTSALGGGPGATTAAGDYVIHNVDCDYPTAASPPSFDVPYFCQFQVSFAPTAAGPRPRTLTFPETSLGPNPSDATLSLTGSGVVLVATTGQRAAAIKKCKKKFAKGTAKRKKCLRRARKLPV